MKNISKVISNNINHIISTAVRRNRVNLLGKQTCDLVGYYISGIQPKSWTKTPLNMKNCNSHHNPEKGLVVFRNNSEIQMVLAGGFKDQSILTKVSHELADRPGDTSRTLFRRLEKSGAEKAQALINKMTYDIWIPKRSIKPSELSLIQKALHSVLHIKYPLKKFYMEK